MDAYNGDAYLFMSKNRRTVKIILYKNHKRHLYDFTFDDDYKFMRHGTPGFLNTINDLRETISSLQMTIKTLQKTIDDLNANEKRHKKEIDSRPTLAIP